MYMSSANIQLIFFIIIIIITIIIIIFIIIIIWSTLALKVCQLRQVR